MDPSLSYFGMIMGKTLFSPRSVPSVEFKQSLLAVWPCSNPSNHKAPVIYDSNKRLCFFKMFLHAKKQLLLQWTVLLFTQPQQIDNNKKSEFCTIISETSKI